MANYVVTQDFYNQEFAIQAYAGDTLSDGDIEPDLVAQWLSSGLIVVEGAELPEPDEESSEDSEE